MKIAENLRLQRKKAGMTQMQLADRLGISIATLRRWEAGETVPTGKKILEIADLFGVPSTAIISEGDMSAINTQPIAPTAEQNKSKGMLIYEKNGTRIELPPTEKGYELFSMLIKNIIDEKKNYSDDFVITDYDPPF
ncbi:MAG: helix-turn-helix domain-containing protein [Synergistaceae bacterium]|nr:helix-turn-helix domain-containing protein [Synergistaceae bacterium]